MSLKTKKIILTLSFDSKDQAEMIANSLQPEIQKEIPTVSINLAQDEEEITLEFSTTQINSLRAAINSYIRWIETAYSVQSL